MPASENKSSLGRKLVRVFVLSVTAFLLLQLISLYLSWPNQAILGTVAVVIGLVANRLSASRVVTLALMLISLTATLRYSWWRIHLVVDFFTDESNNRLSLDSVFMLILLSAEAYTVVIMVLGYMQTAWPLRRVPIPMPGDESLWPHVDVIIPTYNESLALVRYTTLAANSIDYPPEKLHVYILDDGTREDFRQFALEAGVGYVTRKEHSHAKAGNINHALTIMQSEYVTIFDCDHVPTRSFLQMTLGWMLADSNLAMLQTPHHFYSPDPFERNLLQYKTIPNEAELFYGIVQDGNDFWNATFFCGSCALIRRSALDRVGGIATETVTEDAHTSLRMQKLGYNTAYINIPQAAGLATETLAAHVGQRIRWARGMIQIFRTDNPLLARGMKFTQRLCYLNAMIHFLYAVPRLVFLLAPLVYMLLGRTIIPGYWVAILAYSIPHLILSSLTNSRIQGRHRHSFWNEIYEAVLAPYILAPTLLALINPKLGKFNVTDKGGTLSSTRFDKKISTPTRWLLFINFVGLLVAPYRIFVKDPQHPGTVLMNLVWILFNMVILGVAAAVAHEQKQRRSSVRIEARIPMRFRLPDGAQVEAMSMDMSVGGASAKVMGSASLAIGEVLRVAFPEHSGEAEIGGKIVGLREGEVRLAFLVPTIAEQETLTRALYSRADAWLTSLATKEVDRPLMSLWRVFNLSLYGIYQICRSFLPQRSEPAKARVAQTASLILMALMLGSVCQAFGLSFQDGGSSEFNTTLKKKANQDVAKSLASIGGAKNRATGTVRPAAQPIDATESKSSGGTVSQTVTLKDMGLIGAIEMRGSHSYSSVGFTLPYTLVPRHAALQLDYRFNSSVSQRSAWLQVTLNGAKLVMLRSDSAVVSSDGSNEAEIPIPEDLLLRSNTLQFECVGSGMIRQGPQQQPESVCEINTASTVSVWGERLRWQNDLSQLPLPLFDSELQTETTIPVVFLSQPTPQALQSAAAVASWLGVQTGSRPVRFAVSAGQIPQGNAIVFSSSRSKLPVSLQMPSGQGSIIALRSNPNDELGTVLVIAGDNEEELLNAARTLSLTRRGTVKSSALGMPLSSDTMLIPNLTLPRAPARGEAPKWMPTNRPAPLSNCQARDALQTDGSTPVPIYFNVPPDLFYGEKQNLEMRLNYRYNARAVAPGSALRVVVNGNLINEAVLAPGDNAVDRQRLVLVPIADLRPFGNTILFNFDFVPASHNAVQGSAQSQLRGEILCSSSLDLQGLASWARMPNLELFADAGFPFTQLADLSETNVVLPAAPTPEEVSLFLDFMGYFGTKTGYPALQVVVDGPNTSIEKGRDYLVIGTIANQSAFGSLDAVLPVTLGDDGVHVKPTESYLSSLSAAQLSASRLWSRLVGKPLRESMPSNTGEAPDALIEEIESPSEPERSIVLVVLKENASANVLATSFLDRAKSGDIAESVSLLQKRDFESYEVYGKTYHVGNISWYTRMRIWLTQHFLLLLAVVTLLSFVVARWTRQWLSEHARERLKLAEGFTTVA